jgi:hypothetical protein
MSVGGGGEGDHAVPGEREGLSQPAEGVNDVLEAVVVPRDQEEAEVEGGGLQLKAGHTHGCHLTLQSHAVLCPSPTPQSRLVGVLSQDGGGGGGWCQKGPEPRWVCPCRGAGRGFVVRQNFTVVVATAQKEETCAKLGGGEVGGGGYLRLEVEA